VGRGARGLPLDRPGAARHVDCELAALVLRHLLDQLAEHGARLQRGPGLRKKGLAIGFRAAAFLATASAARASESPDNEK